MFTRMFTFITVLALLSTLSVRSAQAQVTPRWLADPPLITSTRFPDTGSQQRFDNIIDMALLDATTGWAVSYGSILHLEQRFWKRFASLPDRYMAHAISLEDAQHGWIVGEEWTSNSPFSAKVVIMRYAGGQWFPMGADIRHKDGSVGPLNGKLNDVVAFPGFALAIGQQFTSNIRLTAPILLSFNGSEWRDITPDGWKYGSLASLSMTSANEGWLTGALGELPNSARPVIMHYRDGDWTEEQIIGISESAYSLKQIIMRDNGDGWAVYSAYAPPCSPEHLLRFRGGIWAVQQHEYASQIVLGLIPGTNRGWISLGGCSQQNIPDRRMRFDNGTMSADLNGTQLMPSAYALLSDDVQWAASGASVLRYSNEQLATAPISAAGPGARFFPETGHSITGEFRRYYEQHGLEFGDRGISARESLALFGYPISEPFDEINPDTSEVYRVQYFERARMELHPENVEPYRVLLGRLAFVTLYNRNGYGPTIPNPDTNPSPPAAGCQRFTETGYDICAPFLSFWKRSGGLPVFGLPMNNAYEEPSITDGKTYLTQWLERERLEYHGELTGTPYEILLGLLGSEDLQLRGYLR